MTQVRHGVCFQRVVSIQKAGKGCIGCGVQVEIPFDSCTVDIRNFGSAIVVITTFFVLLFLLSKCSVPVGLAFLVTRLK